MSVDYKLIRCFDEREVGHALETLADEGWQLHSWQPTTALGVEGAPSHTIFVMLFRADFEEPGGEQVPDDETAGAIGMIG